MKEIWEENKGYNLFRPYMQWATRTSFSKVTVVGVEKVPDTEKASVLIAANHCNCLMDSLVILQSRKEPTAFVARADIFENPIIGKCLHNLKMLPIYRRRDCDNSQEKNVAVFDNVVETISHGLALSIHPEGTHRARRSLLPMKTGVVRMALHAKETYPERPVYIVPAGIEYEDYFHNMGAVTLTYGDPIEIKGGEPVEQTAELIGKQIAELITWFPDDENLKANEKAFYERTTKKYTRDDKVQAIALLPLLLLSGFLALPIIAVSEYLVRGLKDKTWSNTVRFVVKQALTWFTVLGALIAGFSHLSLIGSLLLGAATLYAPPVFYQILWYTIKVFKKI